MHEKGRRERSYEMENETLILENNQKINRKKIRLIFRAFLHIILRRKLERM